MKRLSAAIGLMVLATVTTADAQQPASPGDAHHPPGHTQMPAPVPSRQSQQPGPPAAGMMPLMDMCREMMGGHSMMGPGTMGSGQSSDPETMARMMEMRGEMMKAMGDVMLKHAKRMQETPPTPAK